MADLEQLKRILDPHKTPDKQFFLDLLDGDKQREYEDVQIGPTLSMIKIIRLNKLKSKIAALESEKRELTQSEDYNAEKYRRVLEINDELGALVRRREEYKCFFEEPYFARMDAVDDKEGYNSYYIGKHGDEGLEIVDWRAPLARRYYQKSKLDFRINDYLNKVILRRAVRTRNGKVLDMQNEYLSVKDYLSAEEIGGRDEEAIFDPFLKEILRSRKEKQEITDIIETIQEQQYEIITLPEDAELTVQGVAGSGKTMILLHRLSYLMYNNDKLRPENVLVITPSDSFNAFIDELSAILELEKVKTSTLGAYFIKLLSGVGIDLSSKIDYLQTLPEGYLGYIYSSEFSADVEKKLSDVYDGIAGMFSSDDCRGFVSSVRAACADQQEEYEHIKNAGLRVRRCVLGEIKEKKDGGLYYTKPFRSLFNAVSDVHEFLTLVEGDERMKNHAYFYRQLLSFYRSVRFIRASSDKICSQAAEDLRALSAAVEKEIADLKRYRTGDAYSYPDRIERRRQTLKEIDATICRVGRIHAMFASACDLADVLRGDSYFVSVGKCENIHDVALFFYRETVTAAKRRFGAVSKKLNASDPFAVCFILCKLGYDLSPKYSFVFVDEAQDVSPSEYYVLKTVNGNAKFNVFGDLQQNITPWRGLKDWLELGYKVYVLNRNYRNTNQIVNYVSGHLGADMKPVGLDGAEVIGITPGGISRFLGDKKGLRAVITSEARFSEFVRKSYNLPRETGRISGTRINVMTVYESKGLEFTAVAVADGDLTDNEKYIAYTRALRDLALIR